MSDAFAQLEAVIAELAALQAAGAIMSWDQETYMPPGGAEARAKHRATLARMAHERLTADEVGQLLEQLQADVAGDKPGDDPDADPDADADADADTVPLADPLEDPVSYRALYVKHAAHRFEHARKLPAELVENIAREASLATDAWRVAKESANFSRFAPHLERLVALTIEKAERLGYKDTRYDALLDLYEPDMPTKDVDRVFTELKDRIVPLLAAVTSAPQVDDGPLQGHFDEKQQWDFGMEVLRAIGFDLNRGRQDVSAHPFTTSFSNGDVRITTRIREDDWESGFFATLHEAGHGMHAQGIPTELVGTPLMWRRSLGISESQSRLWENVIGRSRNFWEYFLPKLKARFPAQLGDVSLDAFYRAINRVQPSLIRVEADELTYNLHIFVRFDLERALIEEKLSVRELPDAWNDKMREYVGVTPGNDADGVLQDIHWASGGFGYFPTYTLGNVLSVQLYEQALKEHPDIPEQVRTGRFDDLRIWTNDNVHRYGAMYSPMEIVRRATGRGLDSGPYLNYLEGKYEEIYGLQRED